MTRKKKGKGVPVDNVKKALDQIIKTRFSWLVSLFAYGGFLNEVKSGNMFNAHSFYFLSADGSSVQSAIPLSFFIRHLVESEMHFKNIVIDNPKDDVANSVTAWQKSGLLTVSHIFLKEYKIREFYVENDINLGLLNFIHSARMLLVHSMGNMNHGNVINAQWRHLKITKTNKIMSISEKEIYNLYADLIEDMVNAINKCGEDVELLKLLQAIDLPFVQNIFINLGFADVCEDTRKYFQQSIEEDSSKYRSNLAGTRPKTIVRCREIGSGRGPGQDCFMTRHHRSPRRRGRRRPRLR